MQMRYLFFPRLAVSRLRLISPLHYTVWLFCFFPRQLYMVEEKENVWYSYVQGCSRIKAKPTGLSHWSNRASPLKLRTMLLLYLFLYWTTECLTPPKMWLHFLSHPRKKEHLYAIYRYLPLTGTWSGCYDNVQVRILKPSQLLHYILQLQLLQKATHIILLLQTQEFVALRWTVKNSPTFFIAGPHVVRLFRQLQHKTFRIS